MRLLRHKNGGGKIDETSEACAFSFVDRYSQLDHKTSVWSSALKHTHVTDSTITNSIITDSVVEKSLITGGQIEDSVIAGAELIADYALIKNSTVGRKSRVAHTAHLENVRFENLTVTGDARLINWESGHFQGNGGYISRGIWESPPRILYLASGLTITESVQEKVFCGCREMDIAHWLKVGDRYGKKLGLTVAEVQQIREFLHTLT